MFTSSYQTTTGASFYKAKMVDHLRQAKAEGMLSQLLPGVARLYALIEVNANTKTIPDFDHPVRVQESRDADYWVIDMRPYAAKMKASGNQIPEEGPARLLVNRALLEVFWNVDNPLSLQKAGDFATVVFAKWLSGLMRIKLHADPYALEQIQLITGYYFLQLFITEEQFTPAVAESYAIRLSRLFNRDDAKKTENFLRDVGYMANVADYCAALRKKVSLSSVELVDPRWVFNLVSTSWFGSVDARTLVLSALEFPPVFISMLMVNKERNYKTTIISEIAQKEAMRYKMDSYLVEVKRLLGALETRT